MILIIDAQGSVSERETMTFTEMQQAVGGYVERHAVNVQMEVGGPTFDTMLVWEDARLQQTPPPVNHMATGILGVEVIGDVVLCNAKDLS